MRRRLHINSDQFWTVRGKAIAAYADLEQSLCHLFSYLSDIPRNIAGIVFFKITSARSRNALIEELLTKRKQRQKYSAFWKAYFKDMGQLDQRRNEIVHWMVVSVIDTADPEQPRVDLHLRPPKYWSELGLSSPEINAADMSSFIGKCDVLARACKMFTMALMTKAEPSPDIFLQPLTYPLPDTHPLFRKHKVRRNRRPPSPT